MNKKQHCEATKLLLGIDPHPSFHAFMDEYAWELGRGHRLLRHNLDTIEYARSIYGEMGALEATFHIACDMGLVTIEDIRWAKQGRKATNRQDKGKKGGRGLNKDLQRD